MLEASQKSDETYLMKVLIINFNQTMISSSGSFQVKIDNRKNLEQCKWYLRQELFPFIPF